MTREDGGCRHTCMRMVVEGPEVFYVKGSWFPSRFTLSITDGLKTWVCNPSEGEVAQRADQWDQPVSLYLQTAEQHLAFQQPESLYAFADAGDDHRRLSWAFEKQGTTLEWRWKCEPASLDKRVTANIMDFLFDANTKLSEEVVRKTHSFERMKVEAEKCLAQSETINHDKEEFVNSIYAKFLQVLNSKKAKLSELRDKSSRTETGSCEEESTDNTETYSGGSDEGETSKGPCPLASVISERQKRKARQ